MLTPEQILADIKSDRVKKVIVDGIERSTVIAMGDEDGYNGRSALVPFF